MDMVVYTGGNACSLLSDLISIQGLIHIFFLSWEWYHAYTSYNREEKKFFVEVKILGKDHRPPSLLCINP